MSEQEHEQVRFVKVGSLFVPAFMHHMITKLSSWGIFLSSISICFGSPVILLPTRDHNKAENSLDSAQSLGSINSERSLPRPRRPSSVLSLVCLEVWACCTGKAGHSSFPDLTIRRQRPNASSPGDIPLHNTWQEKLTKKRTRRRRLQLN